MCYSQILFLFAICLLGSFCCMYIPPTLGDFLTFVFPGNIAFKIAAVGADVVVQGGHGNDADWNGIASEGTTF